MGCTEEEAQKFVDAYAKGFPGISAFKKKGSKFVINNGYVLCCPVTGHRMTWPNWRYWLQNKSDFKDKNKWAERISLNGPTQATGGICIKTAVIDIFNWIVDNNYFNKILLEAMVHDELNFEFPEELKDIFPKIVTDKMKEAAAKYCKSVEIPAEAAVGKFWIH